MGSLLESDRSQKRLVGQRLILGQKAGLPKRPLSTPIAVIDQHRLSARMRG
jgi:hypothetical protein